MISLDAATQRAQEIAVWKLLVSTILVHVAKTHEYFTSDDIWDTGARKALPKGVDGRTLGACLRTAGQMKIIEPTEIYRPSTQGTNNKRPVRVWRSRIYEKPQT